MKIKRFLAPLTAVGLLLGAYSAYAAIKGSSDFMYPPRHADKLTPAALGWPFEVVKLQTQDGLHLVGWYIPAAKPSTKGIALYHGHAQNKGEMVKAYAPFLHDAYNLFVYDQRHCGESDGDYATIGALERLDAPMALAELKRRGSTRLGMFGESMGGVVAIDAAAHLPEVRAVWSDCAFDTYMDAVAPRAATKGYPLPTLAARAVIWGVDVRAGGLNIEEADPVRWIAQLAPRPVYLVHGTADDETLPINGERLYATAQEPKTLWRTLGAHHADSYRAFPAEYRQRVHAFFDAAL